MYLNKKMEWRPSCIQNNIFKFSQKQFKLNERFLKYNEFSTSFFADYKKTQQTDCNVNIWWT